MEGEKPGYEIEAAQSNLILDPEAMEAMKEAAGPFEPVEYFDEERKSAVLTRQGLINLFGDNKLLDHWLKTNQENGVFEEHARTNQELPLPQEVHRKMQLTKLRISKDGKFRISGYAWDASDVKQDLEMIGHKFPKEESQDAA